MKQDVSRPDRDDATAAAARWPVVLWAGLALVALCGQGLLVANQNTWSNWTDGLGLGTAFVATYGISGALILSRRPSNPIGRIFLYLTAVIAVSELFGEYAVFAYGAGHPALPLRGALAWVSLWSFFLAFPIGPTLLFLFFPEGTDPGRKWRAVLLLGLIGMTLLVVGFATASGPINPATRGNGTFFIPGTSNPTGFLGSGDTGIAGSIQGAGWGISGLALICSVVASILRLRRSTGIRRQQLKWLAYVAAPVAPAFAIHFLVAITNLDRRISIPDFTQPIYIAIFILGIPLATGVAILRYRLYGIDVVISRTLVYGALAAFITAVYVGIVVGLGTLVGSGGQPNLVLSIVATAVVAVAFQPVRDRLNKFANRLVYGKRATPYEVLSEFSERVAETYAADEALPRMAQVLAEGTGAERAEVWLRRGALLRPAAAWPPEADGRSALAITGEAIPEIPETDRAVAVRHRGELLGALTVTKPRAESMTPVEEKLLEDLAAQAGLVLKNVGLTAELLQRLEELRASRQRLVAAQDEERRRLERNLHDGAQQNLVALKVKLGLAEAFAEKDPARAKELVAQLKSDADEALETLRDLARGIYPPLLADKGLMAALESQARKATLPVSVEASGIGRYPQDIEAAVYFCCLEALQNVQKYAEASRVSLRLAQEDGTLEFEVEDDGKGFDPATAARGAGMTNMADRLDALGGELVLYGGAGAMTIGGRLPVPVLAAATAI